MANTKQQRYATPDEVPEVIRELEPRYVSVSPERVNIQLGGGFFHYGFLAFASPGSQAEKDATTPSEGRTIEKMIDGLWFYME
jgi:hypothetical protein